ncbi:MAG TPA: hypothetical protein PKD67_04005 [Ignavibacteriaceae bacterium]|nr:hypothetical protein [Ignavibacteriaceae bacterium]
MKTLYFLIVLSLMLVVSSYPQQDREKMLKQRSKLHQLEKIKLIEALNLDEDTSVKFFARRNEMQKQIETLEDKSDDILKKLESTLDVNDKNNEAVQRQLINELGNIKDKIESTKKQFINSLNDILSTDKIVRYIVFEQKFRDEIRKIIFDKRRPLREN